MASRSTASKRLAIWFKETLLRLFSRVGMVYVTTRSQLVPVLHVSSLCCCRGVTPRADGSLRALEA